MWALKDTWKTTLTISNHKTFADQPCQEEWISAVLYTAWGYRPAVHLPSENSQDAGGGGKPLGSTSSGGVEGLPLPHNAYSLKDFMQSLMSLWRAHKGSSHPAWCACTAHANGKQTQRDSLFVRRYFFQADVQIFTTWVQSHDVLHLYFPKACRDTLGAPRWSHYCQSASALSLAARMVLKIYITVMGLEQIWLENIITFPRGLHTVIHKHTAKLLILKKYIFHHWKKFLLHLTDTSSHIVCKVIDKWSFETEPFHTVWGNSLSSDSRDICIHYRLCLDSSLETK